MYTVHEMSEKTGVSIRALHHYDRIGLLKPARVTDAGYRLYDDGTVSRLSEILLYREIGFSLKEIKEILVSPRYSRKEAIDQQIRLLEMRRARTDEILALARELRDKGEESMRFSAFDSAQEKEYREEIKARYGGENAYREFEKKEKAGADFQKGGDAIMEIMASFGEIRHLPASCAEAEEKVRMLQKCITDNFYPCTDEILSGLGEMYVSDERFRMNIDRAGGEGTAEFVRSAIRSAVKGK